MARYEEAIEWIAFNDGAGDTPEGMPWDKALEIASNTVTAALVTDVFGKDQTKVGEDILRLRGFRKPRKAQQ